MRLAVRVFALDAPYGQSRHVLVVNEFPTVEPLDEPPEPAGLGGPSTVQPRFTG
jgi:hypothetical protein